MEPDGRFLRTFLKVFVLPVTTLYTLNSNNEINGIVWFTPMDHTSKHRAAFSGIWYSQGYRHTIKAMKFTAISYALAFEFYDAILSTTWQENLLAKMSNLGYTICGSLPNVFDQKDNYIMHLTREGFFGSRFYKAVQRSYGRR
jgi:hypothetical protein